MPLIRLFARDQIEAYKSALCPMRVLVAVAWLTSNGNCFVWTISVGARSHWTTTTATNVRQLLLDRLIIRTQAIQCPGRTGRKVRCDGVLLLEHACWAWENDHSPFSFFLFLASDIEKRSVVSRDHQAFTCTCLLCPLEGKKMLRNPFPVCQFRHRLSQTIIADYLWW